MQSNEQNEDVVMWTKTLHQSINSFNIKQLEDVLIKLNTTLGLEFTKEVLNYSVDGANSVYVAVEAGFEKAVTLLLDTGMVNVTQRNYQNNWTTLHLACYLGLATIVKSLLNFNASVNSVQINELYQLACIQTIENTKSSNQGTALHLAVYSKNSETVNQLLHDVDKISKCYENQCLQNERKYKETINFKGKLFDEFCTLSDKNGNTALHCAVMNKLYNIVDTICQYHSKSIRLPNKHGYTCIYLAKNILKDVRMLSLLIKYSTSTTPSNSHDHHHHHRHFGQHSFKQVNSINSSRVSSNNPLNRKEIKKSSSNLIKTTELIKSNKKNIYKKLKKCKHSLNSLTIEQLNKNINYNYTTNNITQNTNNRLSMYSYHNDDYYSMRTLSTKMSYLSIQSKNKVHFQPLNGLSGNRIDLNERELNRNLCQNIEQVNNETIQCVQNRNNSIENSILQSNSSDEPCLAKCKNATAISTTQKNNSISKTEKIDQPTYRQKKGIGDIDTCQLTTDDNYNINNKIENDSNGNNEDDSDDYYKMNSTRKGICLIINNMMFWHSDFQNRSGCDVDEKSLEKVFESLNFLVKLLRNLSAGEIQAQLEHLGKKTNHNEYDCLIICLMSHGTIGRIYGVDGNSLSIHELTSLFTSDNCPTLAGKPKLFFIQACRGDDYQKGYVIQRQQSIETIQTNQENDINQ
ncbi:Caspase-8, partial [Schistosoma japonicum]